MKKKTFIFFTLCIVFQPFFATAQNIDDTSKSLSGKASIVFIYSFLEDAVINNLYVRSPFFINDTLVCRMTNNHYSVHSVVPGRYKLSVQSSGKKLAKG